MKITNKSMHQSISAQLQTTYEFLADLGFNKAKTGIVLGTGLGSFIHQMTIEQQIPYNEIPHFPVSTVEFHKGNLVLGHINGQYIIAMQGRFHYYEGYNMQEITFPIRLMKMLGLERLFLSNAAGGMNPDFKKGDGPRLHRPVRPEVPPREQGLIGPARQRRQGPPLRIRNPLCRKAQGVLASTTAAPRRPCAAAPPRPRRTRRTPPRCGCA